MMILSEEQLNNRMHQLIYSNSVIHADETPVKVMKIDNDKIKNGKKTYMWVYRNHQLEGSNPIILYNWQPSRKADHPRDFLKDYSGVVVTDGYEVYHKLSLTAFTRKNTSDYSYSDGDIPMDNNAAEHTIRSFTIGRKNFVLIGSSNGAKSSAMLYSLAETAKANLVNTYQYFELLLTEIPKHMNDNDLSLIDKLLPWSPYVQETCPSRYKKS